MPLDYSELKNRLWHAADELRANSRLRSHQHSVPVLGLIFLRYTDYKFSHAQARLARESSPRRRRTADFHPQVRRRLSAHLRILLWGRSKHLRHAPGDLRVTPTHLPGLGTCAACTFATDFNLVSVLKQAAPAISRRFY